MLDLFDEQWPSLLERRPELETRIYHAFMQTFAAKPEATAILAELREHRSEFGAFKSKRAQVLREAGFTVLEPEEDALVGDI